MYLKNLQAGSKTARFTCLHRHFMSQVFLPPKRATFLFGKTLVALGPLVLAMACSYATSDLNKLHRSKKRGSYDKQMVADILDAAVIAHVVPWILWSKMYFCRLTRAWGLFSTWIIQ